MDLEVSKERYKVPTESGDIICRVDKNLEHKLHSASAHLNGLTDLIISLGNHLEIEKEIITKQIEAITGFITEDNKFKKFIIENLDFVKNQNEYIITELKKNKTVDKRPSEDPQDILSITKALESLKIDNIKIVPKPAKYNHWLPRK